MSFPYQRCDRHRRMDGQALHDRGMQPLAVVDEGDRDDGVVGLEGSGQLSAHPSRAVDQHADLGLAVGIDPLQEPKQDDPRPGAKPEVGAGKDDRHRERTADAGQVVQQCERNAQHHGVQRGHAQGAGFVGLELHLVDAHHRGEQSAQRHQQQHRHPQAAHAVQTGQAVLLQRRGQNHRDRDQQDVERDDHRPLHGPGKIGQQRQKHPGQ